MLTLSIIHSTWSAPGVAMVTHSLSLYARVAANKTKRQETLGDCLNNSIHLSVNHLPNNRSFARVISAEFCKPPRLHMNSSIGCYWPRNRVLQITSCEQNLFTLRDQQRISSDKYKQPFPQEKKKTWVTILYDLYVASSGYTKCLGSGADPGKSFRRGMPGILRMEDLPFSKALFLNNFFSFFILAYSSVSYLVGDLRLSASPR